MALVVGDRDLSREALSGKALRDERDDVVVVLRRQRLAHLRVEEASVEHRLAGLARVERLVAPRARHAAAAAVMAERADHPAERPGVGAGPRCPLAQLAREAHSGQRLHLAAAQRHLAELAVERRVAGGARDRRARPRRVAERPVKPLVVRGAGEGARCRPFVAATQLALHLARPPPASSGAASCTVGRSVHTPPIAPRNTPLPSPPRHPRPLISASPILPLGELVLVNQVSDLRLDLVTLNLTCDRNGIQSHRGQAATG